MKKIKIITGGIVGLTFLLSAGIASAADSCEVASSCEELGYTLSSVVEGPTLCIGGGLACPFDSSYMFCPRGILAKLSSTKATWTTARDTCAAGGGWLPNQADIVDLHKTTSISFAKNSDWWWTADSVGSNFAVHNFSTGVFSSRGDSTSSYYICIGHTTF